MMGEELNAAEVSHRGLVGDRAYAVTAAEHNRAIVGVYAARGGTIRRGDSVRIEP